jgi:GT2 family glycosyltransferase
MKQIAVLLTCHNRKPKTLQCLSQLFQQEGSEQHFQLHVYLVDDGSTDGTSEAVKETFPRVHLIQGNGQLYWNRGMHLAWEMAARKVHDYYLWLNDDTMIFPNALLEMLDCAQASDNRAIVCGAIQSALTGDFTYGGKERSGKEVIPNGELQACFSINGNCVLIPETIHTVVGKLDPIFPHAIGDYEYGLRAVKKGFGLVTTRRYIGNCERNAHLPKWCYQEVPFALRMKALYSPLGNAHPYYFFIYEKRHKGLPTAVFHFITIHLRAFIPSLWK